MITPQRVLDRVLAKATRTPTGCLVSTYSTGSHGYAQVAWQEAGVPHHALCHRVVWEATHGPIPEGMTVDHTCKVKICLDLSHLRLLTNFDNARRTHGRDWPLGECANGHPDTHLQTVRGHTRCRLCRNQQERDRRRRKAAAARAAR